MLWAPRGRVALSRSGRSLLELRKRRGRFSEKTIKQDPLSGEIAMDSGCKSLMLIALAALGFAIAPPAHGQTETILYSFCSQPNCADGSGPNNNGSLAQDAKGNFYGTTEAGGAYNLGTVFELSPSGSGWTETVLHSF